MTLLDRHLFRSVLSTCIAAVALFAFVLMLGNAVRDLLPYLLSGQIGALTFARLIALLIPFVVSYALPLGMLTGVLLTLGRLSSDSEITAMRASGLGIVRIARPILVLGVLGALLGLKVNFESMPWARVEYHRELAAAVRADPLRLIEPKTFTRTFPGCVIYVGDKHGSDLRDCWIWQLDGNGRATKFIHAESGRATYDEASNAVVVQLFNCACETRDAKNPENFTQAPPAANFEKADPIRLSLESLFGRPSVNRKLQWTPLPDLRAEEARLDAAARSATGERASDLRRQAMKISLVIQEKATLSLAVFSFALIGVPLGIKVSRRETSANLGVAVVLALGYYFLTTMVGWLDRHPAYHPDLLLWVPDLLFIGVGIRLLTGIDRR